MKKKKLVHTVLIGLAAFILGVFAAAPIIGSVQSSSAEQILEAYPKDLSMSGQHRHVLKNVPEDQAPSVDLDVEEDPMMPGHFNLHIKTENFEFAPRNASSEFVLGQGHAHVFVDDVKISRSYAPWYHLPRLDPGQHRINVTLNTNNHKEYAVNGEKIMDSVTVSVAEDAPRMKMDMSGDSSMDMGSNDMNMDS